jgi:hypothetical protein
MITNDQQLKTTLERIRWFQEQEIDRMQLEVREYLSTHPSEVVGAV